ncbi:MarR family winged helix-turn-helix transcriptional regulator [Rhodococcus sp. IEGM1428]|uniref:MarR family winged helix-turn-helix transcriptional regulator n=1 Tax=Rhodococcus sp. IEGM1428 TaxID=3392191 RepID=UPI003D0BF3AD
MREQPSRPEAALEEQLLRFIDLIAFSSSSNALRRRFEIATDIPLARFGLETTDILSGGPLTVGEIAEALEVDLTRASRQVAALVVAGLVEKERTPTDRRRVRITMTERGIDVLDRWNSSWHDEMRGPLEDWSVDDLVTFTEFLTAVTKRLDPLIPRTDHRHHPEPNDNNPVTRCLEAIVSLVRLVGKAHFDDALRSAGSTLTELSYLVLRDVEVTGPSAIGQIASRLDQAQSAVSRAAHTLESRGLVHAEIGRDRRTRLLVVSDAGARLSAHIRTTRLDDLLTVFADVPNRTRARYTALTTEYLERLMSTADSAARRYL